MQNDFFKIDEKTLDSVLWYRAYIIKNSLGG
jgi:hypothetical protein